MSKQREAPKPVQLTAINEDKDGLPLSECRSCGSTNRGPYVPSNSLELDGKLHQWLRTKCTDCGQARVDRVTSDIEPTPAPQE